MFTGIPIVVFMFVGAVLQSFFLPPLTYIPLYVVLIFVLGLVGAAKIADVFRHELVAVSLGQLESARVLGLSSRKAFWLVTMPLAYKRAIPQIAIEISEVFQNTSIVAVIGVLSPVGLINAVLGTAEWFEILWELYIAIALGYWIISFSIVYYSKSYEKKLMREQSAAIT